MSQQDKEIDISSPNMNPNLTGTAQSFISQEVNSASNVESALPPVTMAKRVTFNVPTMFSNDVVNLVTAGIYYGEGGG